MYRTDKQFMTNPATAGSRIYIGGIPKTVVAADLEEKFKNHGKILGLVLQMGFAFIQFENEMQAQAAIRIECNSMLHGRKITVKQALDKSKKAQQNQPNQNYPLQMRKPGPPPPPQVHHEPKPPSQAAPRIAPNPPQQIHPELAKEQQDITPPPAPTASNIPQNNQPDSNNSTPISVKNPVNTNNGSKVNLPLNSGPGPQNASTFVEEPLDKRPRKRRMTSRERFPGAVDVYREDAYYGKPGYSVPFNRPPIIDQPDRNDCEIIVVSKNLTKYAEYIEQRLKNLGLIVDLLFPNEDVPIGRVLANISSRGCLYAILVMPQNEEHRSLTLNVLHGLPQEHRNMPIEDALVLITRNFDAYMRGDKTSVETVGFEGTLRVSDRHPTSMQLLLNLLAENRQITSSQYDKLLKYLQDRREVQHQHEVAEGVDQESQESNSKQAELQSRIMNILNKTAVEPPPAPPAPEASQPSNVAPPLLKDPSVQKALDSLLGGEMFKNISATI